MKFKKILVSSLMTLCLTSIGYIVSAIVNRYDLILSKDQASLWVLTMIPGNFEDDKKTEPKFGQLQFDPNEYLDNDNVPNSVRVMNQSLMFKIAQLLFDDCTNINGNEIKANCNKGLLHLLISVAFENKVHHPEFENALKDVYSGKIFRIARTI